MNLLPVCEISKEKIVEFFNKHWGSSEMVTSTGVYDCTNLNSFAVLNDTNDIIGLVTYIFTEDECEIISLDSIYEGKGIGSALVQRVEEVARNANCKRITVITTNDNLLALKFYQKRGYYLSNLVRNAVDEARKQKPEIPLIGNDDIPIRDELTLEKLL